MSAWGFVEAQESLFRHSPVPLICVDENGQMLGLNQAAVLFLGLTHSDTSGCNLLSFLDGCDRSYMSSLLSEMSDAAAFDIEVTVRRFDATTAFARLIGAEPRMQANGHYARQVALIDIARQREAEKSQREMHARFHHASTHDPLTGLPNRFLFENRLAGLLTQCRVDSSTGALIFIDLDQFKSVNEFHGYAAGDAVLQEIAGRLLDTVASSEMLCRYSSDEFIVMLENVGARNDVEKMIENMRHVIAQPIQGVLERALSISATFGATVFDHETKDMASLVLQAETAMLQAKRNAGTRCGYYSPVVNNEEERRRLIEADLVSAVDRDQLSVVYQPQYRDQDRRMVGCEALLRWSHPEAGQILPGEFIDVAEKTQISSEILRFVLGRVCADARRWLDDGLEMARVSVNVSALDLSSDSFVKEVEQALDRSGLPPDKLEIEVTETSMMRYPEAASVALTRLSNLGVSIALDDFGTGYSSLSCFMDFPFNRVKIDQAFVKDLPTSSRAQAVVRAVSAMVNRLALDVVAEGIETDAQRACLRDCGVEQMQGYLFAYPMDEGQFRSVVTNETSHGHGPVEITAH